MTKHKPFTADGGRVYIVYDARAASGDTDDAEVFESFDAPSDRKAKQQAYRMWREQPYVLYGATFKDGIAIEDESPLTKHWC